MPVAALGSAAIGAAGSIFGGYEQSQAAKAGIAAQQQMFGTGLNWAQQEQGAAASALNPFITAGGNALLNYTNALPELTKPFNAGSLVTTPGYEFDLTQGLKGVASQFAPQGLAGSGAASRGAASFATGLAQNTYNQQFQNYLAQNAQRANLLYQPVQTGAAAAGTLAGVEGSLGGAGLGGAVQTGQGIAGSLAGYGNALAGGAAGVSNALTGGVNNALLYSLLSGSQSGGVPGAIGPTSLGGAPLGAAPFNFTNLLTSAFNPAAG